MLKYWKTQWHVHFYLLQGYKKDKTFWFKSHFVIFMLFFIYLLILVYIFAFTVSVSDDVLTVLNQQVCALYLEQGIFCERQIWQ